MFALFVNWAIGEITSLIQHIYILYVRIIISYIKKLCAILKDRYIRNYEQTNKFILESFS
jgi:hypothetical protein